MSNITQCLSEGIICLTMSNKKDSRPSSRVFSGKGGIRTLGGHKAHNGFRDRPIQPLWHLPKKIVRAELYLRFRRYRADRGNTPRASSDKTTSPLKAQRIFPL